MHTDMPTQIHTELPPAPAHIHPHTNSTAMPAATATATVATVASAKMDGRARLDALYRVWQSLGAAPSRAALEQFGAFFDESCTAWIKSMRYWDRPATGRAAIVAEAAALAATQQIEERRVLACAAAADGRTVMCEMRNRLRVLGQPLDHFHETAVATFDDAGLIVNFRVYSCRSPIVAILQTKTGHGPYADDVARAEIQRIDACNAGKPAPRDDEHEPVKTVASPCC